MAHTIFIADLHLTDKQSQTANIFYEFLQSEILATADALYILGDFFAMWAGDDDYSPFNEQIKQAIRKIAAKIPVFLMPGNRDFILGKKFATQCNCSLLPDPYKIELYGVNTLLAHGDILCSKDSKQIIFRKLTQNEFSRHLFLMLPLILRQKMALLVHKISGKSKKSKTADMMDVDDVTVRNMLRSYQCTQLIHGHTHKPNIYDFVLENQPVRRIVLGAWDNSDPQILIYYETGPVLTGVQMRLADNLSK